MAENSAIEWTTHTFNPWRGCTKISPGCANCYAEKLSHRNPLTLGVWGPNGTRVVAAESMWREPLKWDAAAKAAGVRHRVFCASLADVFEDWQGDMTAANGQQLFLPHNSWEDRREWIPDADCGGGEPPATMGNARNRLFRLIDSTPHLDWLILTKRPENIAKMMPPQANSKVLGAWTASEVLTRSNLWLGTSVENQEQANKRIPHLLKVPAAVRFLSCEPLLGPVDFILPMPSEDRVAIGRGHPSEIDWVIVGGESGPNARPMHPDWARSLRDQCQDSGVPFFFKQWGEWCGGDDFWSGTTDEAGPSGLYADLQNGTVIHDSKVKEGHWKSWLEDEEFQSPNDPISVHVGKKAAGRLLDGREWSEFPNPVSQAPDLQGDLT